MRWGAWQCHTECHTMPAPHAHPNLVIFVLFLQKKTSPFFTNKKSSEFDTLAKTSIFFLKMFAALRARGGLAAVECGLDRRPAPRAHPNLAKFCKKIPKLFEFDTPAKTSWGCSGGYFDAPGVLPTLIFAY